MNLLCVGCGKAESPSLKLLTCARCRGAFYCGAACQKQSYPDHKVFCKEAARMAEAVTNQGTHVKGNKHVWSWVQSLPGLYSQLMCIAWRCRSNSPVLRVVGGVDGRLEEIMVITKGLWMPEDDGSPLGWAYRFAESDFDKDKHFFVEVAANHPGSDRWPACSNRILFNEVPEAMDGWVDRCAAELQALKLPFPMKDRRQTWVLLKGLRVPSLNGQKARIRSSDPETMSYCVKLENGKIISVKHENIEELEPVRLAPADVFIVV